MKSKLKSRAIALIMSLLTIVTSVVPTYADPEQTSHGSYDNNQTQTVSVPVTCVSLGSSEGRLYAAIGTVDTTLPSYAQTISLDENINDEPAIVESIVGRNNLNQIETAKIASGKNLLLVSDISNENIDLTLNDYGLTSTSALQNTLNNHDNVLGMNITAYSIIADDAYGTNADESTRRSRTELADDLTFYFDAPTIPNGKHIANVEILRIHDGTCQNIEYSYDAQTNKYSFSSKLFSIFIFVYDIVDDEYSIELENKDGAGNIFIDDSITPATERVYVPAGQRIHLNAEPKEGYEFTRWVAYNAMELIDIDDKNENVIDFDTEGGTSITTYYTDDTFTTTASNPSHPSLNEPRPEIATASANSVWFDAPARDGIKIVAEYAPINNGSLYRVLTLLEPENGTIAATYDSEHEGYVLPGETVTVTAYPKNGFQLAGYYVNNDYYLADSDVFTFNMPDVDTIIRADIEGIPHYVTLNATHGKVYASGSTNMSDSDTEARLYGYQDIIQLVASPDDGYTFDSWTVNNGDITLGNKKAAGTTFVMGLNDVSITANFKAVTTSTSGYTLTLQSDGNGSVSGGNRFEAGTVVNIKATPNSGYTFKKWDAANDVYFLDNTDTGTKIIMPAHDVTVKAIFEKKDSGNNNNSNTSINTNTNNKGSLCSVVFKDWNGVVIKTETGYLGAALKEPCPPKDFIMNGQTYSFVHWWGDDGMLFPGIILGNRIYTATYYVSGKAPTKSSSSGSGVSSTSSSNNKNSSSSNNTNKSDEKNVEITEIKNEDGELVKVVKKAPDYENEYLVLNKEDYTEEQLENLEQHSIHEESLSEEEREKMESLLENDPNKRPVQVVEENKEEQQQIPWWLILLIIVALLGCGAVVVWYFVFFKKHRNNDDDDFDDFDDDEMEQVDDYESDDDEDDEEFEELEGDDDFDDDELEEDDE